ncbi:uncharacterized protein ACMZJ9_014458 [Mantella aurantiaca]
MRPTRDLNETNPGVPVHGRSWVKRHHQVAGSRTEENLTIPHHHQVDGNPPERCPRPLYSRDSTQEPHKILPCYQYKKMKDIKTEVKEEAEDPHVTGDDRCKEEEIPPEISTDPGDTRDTQRNIKTEVEEGHVRIKEEKINTDPRDTHEKAEEEGEGHMKIKEEDIPPEISKDSRDRRDLRNIKTEMKKEGNMDTKGKAILEINMDGRYRSENEEKHPTTSCVPSKDEKPYLCSECGKRFRRKYALLVHMRLHTGEKPFFCPDCGKCFSDRSNLNYHKRTHATVEDFQCSECGRRCQTFGTLTRHQTAHFSKTEYRCSKCSESFPKRFQLKKHEKLHAELKPG